MESDRASYNMYYGKCFYTPIKLPFLHEYYDYKEHVVSLKTFIRFG